MKIDGVLIEESEFSNLCAKYKITNTEWVSWIMDTFERNKKQFIIQSIKIGTEEIQAENNKIRRGNKQ